MPEGCVRRGARLFRRHNAGHVGILQDLLDLGLVPLHVDAHGHEVVQGASKVCKAGAAGSSMGDSRRKLLMTVACDHLRRTVLRNSVRSWAWVTHQ